MVTMFQPEAGPTDQNSKGINTFQTSLHERLRSLPALHVPVGQSDHSDLSTPSSSASIDTVTTCQHLDARHAEQTRCLPASCSYSSQKIQHGKLSATSAGKSAKRKAAEALLASRYGRQASPGVAGAQEESLPAKRHSSSTADTRGSPSTTTQKAGAGSAATEHIHVAACQASCSFASQGGNDWCQYEVRLPHVQWSKVFQDNASAIPVYRVADGYQKWYLSEGVQVLLVENPHHLPDALAKLKASMKDPVVAMDLEWRPEMRAGRFSPVALIQMATSTTCLLLRVCRMQFKLPPALLDFLADPEVHVVGFSWDTADEAKMVGTFQAGRGLFARFTDVQAVASQMGYPGYGLAKLTTRVLGMQMPKPRKVTMSNWEERSLSPSQVKYAALDALVTGMLYRVLRLWHASSSPCAVCRQPLGAHLPSLAYTCPACPDKSFDNFNTLVSHARHMQHALNHEVCTGCGRVHRLSKPKIPPGKPAPPAATQSTATAATGPRR